MGGGEKEGMVNNLVHPGFPSCIKLKRAKADVGLHVRHSLSCFSLPKRKSSGSIYLTVSVAGRDGDPLQL